MQRILALVFLLAFHGVLIASGGAQVFNSGSFQGLKDVNGGILIPPVYDALGWSSGVKEPIENVIGYFENGRWGLINSKNKRLTEAKFTILEAYDDSRIKAAIKGHFTNHLYYGLLDKEGKTTIDFHFFSIEKWTDNIHLVSEYRDGSIYYGTCNEYGKLKTPLAFKSIRKEGPMLVAQKQDGSLVLYNGQGDPMLHETVDQLKVLTNGYLVTRNGQSGWIDLQGTITHPIVYKSIQIEPFRPIPFKQWEARPIATGATFAATCDSLTQNDRGLWIAHLNHVDQLLGGSELLLDRMHKDLMYIGDGFMVTRDTETTHWAINKTDGSPVVSGQDTIIVDQNYFYCHTAKGWDIYSLFGKKINKWSYEDVGFSTQRNIPVKKNNYWGWIDFEGNQLIEFKYDEVVGTENGFFLANYIGFWGMANFSDTFIIPPKYTSIVDRKPFFIANQGLAKTIYDKEGTEIYRSGANLSNTGPLTFEENGKYGLICENAFIVEPLFDSISTIPGYFLLFKSGYVSLIDTQGKLMFPAKMEIQQVLGYSEGFFHVIKDGQHGFVDQEGRLRIANRYEDARNFRDSLAAIKLRNKWGIIDHQERLIIQPFYQEVGDFNKGLAVVRLNNNYGLVDKKGTEVLPVEWKKIKRLSTFNYLLLSNQGNAGIADETGKILLMPNYQSIKDTPDGLLIVEQGGKMGVMDYRGYTKVPAIYTQIEIKGGYLLLQK